MHLEYVNLHIVNGEAVVLCQWLSCVSGVCDTLKMSYKVKHNCSFIVSSWSSFVSGSRPTG